VWPPRAPADAQNNVCLCMRHPVTRGVAYDRLSAMVPGTRSRGMGIQSHLLDVVPRGEDEKEHGENVIPY
jgi:hypothetical protein